MKGKHRPLGFVVVLALGLALMLGGGFTRPALASSEDVAMFYDDLSQYGQWVDYENYGPVWSPSNVNEDWRPYTDGRWVPTNDGYVFESQEPWGWATYHYGNWMPTPGYGWVWKPGRTWYPSTVEWRTSPETQAVDTSYVGWAPIPPPDYVPTQAYAPPGYYQGMPSNNLLTEPLWIFARAASFLLGFGQPYSPAYSYGGCGCLAPPSYVPVFFPQTVYCPTYLTPTYYPPAYFGGVAPSVAYGYGPSVGYISRVTNINQTVINQTINNNTVNITRIHNVVAPAAVINSNVGLRHIQPPALTEGRPLPPPHRLTNVNVARANLSKPNIVAAPQGVPPLRAQIPRAQPLAAQPQRGVVPGATLPAKATMQLTPRQQQQVQKLPPNRQITPVRPTLTGQPAAPGAAPQVQPGVQPGAKPGQVKPGFVGQPGQVQPGVAPHPGATPAVPPTGPKPGQVPPGVKPGATPAVPGFHGPATPAVPPTGPKPGQVPPGVKPGATPAVPGFHGPATPAVPPTGPKPGQVPPGVKPGATPAVPGFHGPATPAIPPSGVKPAAPVPAPRPQPQPQHVTPPAPHPQPQMQPRPQPQPQMAPRPQPQPQPRPQPQMQPRPAPQPQAPPRVAPQAAPRPQPAPQPHPQPAPQKQQQQQPKQQPKPGEQPR